MVLKGNRRERYMPMLKELICCGNEAIYGFIVLCQPVNFITNTTEEIFNIHKQDALTPTLKLLV